MPPTKFVPAHHSHWTDDQFGLRSTIFGFMTALWWSSERCDRYTSVKVVRLAHYLTICTCVSRISLLFPFIVTLIQVSFRIKTGGDRNSRAFQLRTDWPMSLTDCGGSSQNQRMGISCIYAYLALLAVPAWIVTANLITTFFSSLPSRSFRGADHFVPASIQNAALPSARFSNITTLWRLFGRMTCLRSSDASWERCGCGRCSSHNSWYQWSNLAM